MPTSDPEGRPRRWPLVLALALTWGLGSWVRLRALDSASIGSDALGQYLAAWSAGWTWIPRPPNPESGPGLWLLSVPLVHAAPSLVSLAALRFAMGALVAPLGASAAWAAAGGGRRGWAALMAAGAVLAVEPGLVDTLLVAFRGYGAPELLAGATLFLVLALRGHRLALAPAAVLGVLAADQHPLAGGAALGALVALPWLVRAVGWKGVVIGALAGVLFALPRLLGLVRAASCGAGWVECLGQVALGSAEPEVTTAAMVGRALHDRFVVEAPGLWFGLLAGLVACAMPWPSTSRPGRALLAWALGATLGVALLGLSLHTFRSYHLRIVAGPLAVAAAVGLARAWPLALLWAGQVWVTLAPLQAVGPDPGGLHRADAAAAALLEVPGPLRVDAAWMDGPAGLDPAALVLAAVLQGQEAGRFSLEDGAAVVLVVNGTAEPGSARVLDAGQPGTLLLFSDIELARRWVAAQPAPPWRVGGAYDWDKALHPATADLGRAAW